VYLDEHRSAITAIQLLAEARDRRVSFDDIKELADRIARPPYNWTPDVLWNAYVALGTPGRSQSTTHRRLADLVSLIRFTLGEDDELVPYADRVRERYQGWVLQQEHAGVTFSTTERWWLDRIVQVIAASAGISPADLDNAPFIERGGTDGAIRDLGDRAAWLIEELNQELTA
jgi:type I restriction enzyme R subunit